MNYRVIRECAVNYSIMKMCRFLKVSRSGYYKWSERGESIHQQQDRELAKMIRAIFEQSKQRYGSPRIYDELSDLGIRCSRKRVARLMREMGFKARHKRKFKETTNSKHNYPIAPNLLDRQFQTDAPNQVWVADITYIRTLEGWLYLAAVMDLFSRKIVGWAMSERMTSDLAITALKMAIKRRKPHKGLMHHSDRGVQYASNPYRKVLKKNGIICSMSRKGNCWDNAPMESFFHSLKVEWLNDQTFLTRAAARQASFTFIEVWYNRQRLHSTLGYQSPETFERRLAA
jgi:putative transposase